MKVSQKEVDYVAALANLELTDVERLRMEKDLNAILDYIDQLSELDTNNVQPMSQIALEGAPVEALRPDELRDCLPRELALKNAPQSDGTFFRVPKVIER